MFLIDKYFKLNFLIAKSQKKIEIPGIMRIGAKKFVFNALGSPKVQI